MAYTIYKGATKKLLLAVVDKDGAPISWESIDNVEVYIKHDATKQLYAKYSLTPNTEEGFITCELNNDSPAKVIIPLNAAQTALMDTGKLLIKTKTFMTDADFDINGGDGLSVTPGQGFLATVMEF